MRKPGIIAVVTIVVATLLASLGGTTTAQASNPASAAAPNLRAACQPEVQTKEGPVRTLRWDDGGGLRPGQKAHARGGPVHAVAFQTVFTYRVCGADSRYIISKSEYINPDFTGCISQVQNFKSNVNALGNWNPGEVTVDCRSGVSYYSDRRENTATNQYIFRSDPANERCFASRYQVSLSGSWDMWGTSETTCFMV